MFETTKEFYNEGKKSLESLLREKAYTEVEAHLKNNSIDINKVSDEDIEALVATKAKDMMNGIKGFGIGTAFAIAISLVTGI